MKLKRLLSVLFGVMIMSMIGIISASAEELTSGYWQYEVQKDGTVYITGYTSFTDKLTIPSTINGKTVSGIANEAFRGSDAFTSVSIPSTVKYIGQQSFAGTEITSVTIPSSVTTWGTSYSTRLPSGEYLYDYPNAAFAECSKLKTVTINSNLVPSGCFYDCNALTTATIAKASELGNNAFAECEKLSTVTMNSSSVVIGNSAFLNDTALKTITSTDKVISIGEKSFYNCSSLSSFTFENKLVSIGQLAFAGSGLTSVSIPNSVTSWGKSYSVYMPSGEYKYDGYPNAAFAECEKLTSVTYNASLVPSYVFYNCDALKTVTLNTEEIGYRAFDSCNALTKVTFGDDVVTVGDYAFANDAVLATVTTDGARLLEIGNYAFYKCSALKSITLGHRLTTIGHQAFAGSGLTTVTIPDTVTLWGTSYSANLPGGQYLYGYPNAAFAECPNLKNVYFGYGTTGKSMFYGSSAVHIYGFSGTDAITYAQDNSMAYSIRTSVPSTSITLNTTSAVLAVGQKLYLDYTFAPSNSTDGVTWTSGDESVASCVSGIITANKEGNVAIRAKTTSGKIAVCNITIVKDKPADVLDLTVKSTTSNSVKLGWSQNGSVNGYIIEKKTSSGWTRVAKVSDTTYSYTVTGLSASTTYNFRVRSYRSVSAGTVYGDYFTVTAKTAAATTTLSKVSGFKVTSSTTNLITLAWNKNDTATGYIIEKKVGSDWERVAKITSNATTSYKVANLANAGKTYTFRIKAYKSGTTTAYSDYVSVSGTTVPNAVTGFKSTAATKNSITLAWNKNSTAGGYIIEKKVGSDWERVAKITSNATTSYKVTNLANEGKTYTFRIRAYKNETGTAVYSANATASGTTTTTQISVNKVTGLNVKARTTSSVTLGWTKNNTAAGYIIEKKVGSSWERVAKISSNATVSYKIALANPGKTYTFRIKAYNNTNGNAVYSDYTNIEASTTPAAVKGLTAKSNATKAVTLSWTKDSYADGYIIEKKVGSEWQRVTKISSNATVKYTVSGLANSGKSYTFRVKTYKNDNGTALYGTAVSVSATTK